MKNYSILRLVILDIIIEDHIVDFYCKFCHPSVVSCSNEVVGFVRLGSFLDVIVVILDLVNVRIAGLARLVICREIIVYTR